MAAQDDDLDDMLESALEDMEIQDKLAQARAPQPQAFKPPPLNLPQRPAPVTTTTTTTSSSPGPSHPAQNTKTDEELAEQFAKQMTDLMRSFQAGDFEKNIEELARTMGLPEEEGEGEESSQSSSRSSSRSGRGGSGNNSDDADLTNLLSTLGQMGTSPTPSLDSVGDIAGTLKKLAESAKNLGDKDINGEEFEKTLQDFESNPEFQSVMEGIVNQMISKDILYEPMKELREKYPKWLAEKHATLPEEEYEKYIKQYDIVQKICVVYESSSGGGTAEQMQEVVQLMQEMAEYGQPPQDIIKDLAPGVQIGADGLPVFPGGEEGDSGGAGCSIM